jgi:hypothetical protein
MIQTITGSAQVQYPGMSSLKIRGAVPANAADNSMLYTYDKLGREARRHAPRDATTDRAQRFKVPAEARDPAYYRLIYRAEALKLQQLPRGTWASLPRWSVQFCYFGTSLHSPQISCTCGSASEARRCIRGESVFGS